MSWISITDLKNELADNLRQFLVDYSDNLPTMSAEVEGETVEFSLFDNDKWDDPLDPDDSETDSMKDLAEVKAESDVTLIVSHIQDNIKTGRANLAAAATVAVSGLGFSDVDYSILLTASVTSVRIGYTGKTSDGFTVNASAPVTATVDWVAIHD